MSSRLVFGSSSGSVYALDPLVAGAPTIWSRSTRRVTCATDSISAPTVVQRRAESNAAFQAAVNTDLVLVGTAAGCATSTANRVFALDIASGNVFWTFNQTGSQQMDTVTGLAVDYARNHVYVVTDKPDPQRVQSTLWALNTINAGRIWSEDLGSIRAQPLLANGGLFVVTLAGVLYKINPDNGSTLWSLPLFPEGTAQVELDMAFHEALDYVFVTDSAGTLRVIRDDATAGTVLLSTNLQGDLARSPAVVDPYGEWAYVGDDDSGMWHIGMCTLTPARYLGDDSPGGVARELAVELLSEGRRLYTVSPDTASLRKWCIPWNMPPQNPDGDSDGTPDCLDGCPNDPDKVEPGVCGCGVADVDTDGDTILDCLDPCPLNPPLAPVGATLALAKQAGGSALLTWTAEDPYVAWNLYSGSVTRPFAYNETCLETWIESPQTSDARLPEAGQAFYYLVSAVNGCEETPSTLATAGPHSPPAPCQLVCQPGDPCSDSNVCTADSCDPGAGCQHVPVPSGCEDGDACTTNDACVSGVCTGGPPANCDDGNPCTDDSCDAPNGCQHFPTATCDDGDACTDDSCDAQSGCGHSPDLVRRWHRLHSRLLPVARRLRPCARRRAMRRQRPLHGRHVRRHRRVPAHARPAARPATTAAPARRPTRAILARAAELL